MEASVLEEKKHYKKNCAQVKTFSLERKAGIASNLGLSFDKGLHW